MRFVYTVCGILIDKQQTFIVKREKIEKIESTNEKKYVVSLPSKNLDEIFNGIERKRKSKIIKFRDDLEKNCQLDETINESISDQLYRILRNWGLI